MTPTLWHFDSQDNQIGQIHDVQVFAKDFEVNGARTLDVKTRQGVSKLDRLVFRDEVGRWEEYIVLDVPEEDDGTGREVKGTDSSAELGWDYIEDRRPTGTPAELVAAVLQAGGSRWESLGSDIEAEPAKKIFYHTNVLKALNRIASDNDGELRTEISVEDGHVTRRAIGVFKREGEDHGLRFEYGSNLLGVKRSRGTDPVYTRVYGWGRGVAVVGEDDEITGYGRRLSFADVNGGRAYVESSEALEKYGRPDGKRGKAHVQCDVVFEDETDANALLEKTRAWAEDQYELTWSYEASVFWLAAGGLDTEGVGEGDVVTVVDPEFDPPIRDKSRIASGHVDYLRPEKTRYQIGRVQSVVSATISDQQQAVEDIVDKSPGWDGAADTVETIPETWLRQQMRRLNEEFNAAGQCYKFTSFEKGDIWANGPLTAEGKPEGATDHAINLCGLGFRIASSVRDGDFDWTTFGTGDGFTADLINVGRLVCGDNYLDLETGEMRIALTAQVGEDGQSIEDYVQEVSDDSANAVKEAVDEELSYYVQTENFDNYLNMTNVFNAITNNGRDKGLFIQDGHVMFNGDYVRTGIISSTDGNSFWDLDQGYFQTLSRTSVVQYHEIASRIDNGMFAVKMDQTDIVTIAAYARGDNPNYHPAGIKAFTDLVLACPGDVGVSFDDTGSSTLNYTPVMKNDSLNYVTAASKSGGTVTLNRWSASIQHGMVVSKSDVEDSSFDVGSGSSEKARLVASVEEASNLSTDGPLEVREVNTVPELMEAAEAGSVIWAIDAETNRLGIPVYSGEEWSDGIPTQEPTEPIVIASPEYVDARAEVMQSEIEAVVDALAPAIGTAQAKTLMSRLSTSRVAMATGEVERMATVAASMGSGTSPLIEIGGDGR